MDTPKVIINGEIYPGDKAFLKIDDLSIVRGYAIFDFFKTIDETPIFLEDNLDRFFSSASQMDLTVPFTRQQIREQIRALMITNQIPNSGIKLLLTGGYSPDGYSLSTSNLIITQSKLTRNLSTEKSGMRLITFPYHRPFGTVKSIDYVMGIHAMKKARELGADDVVYVQNNLLSECPRANIFLVDEHGTLITPSGDVLAGITRKYVLAVASKICQIEIRDVTIADMKNAKEAFITSTTKNITPITAIDNTDYDPTPGPISLQLQAALEKLIFENKGLLKQNS